MRAQLSNAQIRELVAERDYLKQRNIDLSESLDANGMRYRAILESLGFDEEGQPLPKDESAGEPVPTGVPADGEAPAADSAESDNPRKK